MARSTDRVRYRKDRRDRDSDIAWACVIRLVASSMGRTCPLAGTCGAYPFEVAETNVAQVHDRARESGYPLRASIEEEPS